MANQADDQQGELTGVRQTRERRPMPAHRLTAPGGRKSVRNHDRLAQQRTVPRMPWSRAPGVSIKASPETT